MLLCLLVALGSAWLAWLALKGRTPWDALEAMPLTPLSEARHGEVVRVRGRAVPVGAPLRTPNQGRPCVGYRVEQQGMREAWATFELHDGTARALVETSSVDVLFAHSREGAGWRESWVEVDAPLTVRARVVREGEVLRLAAPGGEPLRMSDQERLAR